MSEEKPRQIAASILEQRQTTRAHLEDILEARLNTADLSAADRGLCQALVYGVTRWERTLDWLIERKTGGRKQKTRVQVLLQLGLFQILWLDRIPDHAAVNETVSMAKAAGLNRESGFVNAVLRAYTREQVETKAQLEELKLTDPSLAHSHPGWLFARWRHRWGTERAAQFMAWNNLPPPTYARLNRLKSDAPTLAAAWKKEGVKFSPATYDWTNPDEVFVLEEHPPLAQLDSFKSGFFYIQDPSTLLAVRWLSPKPGETVLDLCAAPGGKTAFIAQCMENRGTIIAQDRDAERLQLLKGNCARLGVTCVSTELATAVQGESIPRPGGTPQFQFDRVLVDAPCSNTGVMRRRLEVRWRLRAEQLPKLAAAQVELLDHAAARLRPSGLMVYSTCSVEPEENAGVVRHFLDSHRDFSLEEQRELLPFAERVDGAFVAKLRRKS